MKRPVARLGGLGGSDRNANSAVPARGPLKGYGKLDGWYRGSAGGLDASPRDVGSAAVL